jgi:hypothetical protein
VTDTEWLEAFEELCGLWPDARFSDATFRAWWPHVQDLDAAAVHGVLGARAYAGKPSPSNPGELRRLVREDLEERARQRATLERTMRRQFGDDDTLRRMGAPPELLEVLEALRRGEPPPHQSDRCVCAEGRCVCRPGQCAYCTGGCEPLPSQVAGVWPARRLVAVPSRYAD